MDFVKIWSNLLAVSSPTLLPTTFFIHGFSRPSSSTPSIASLPSDNSIEDGPEEGEDAIAPEATRKGRIQRIRYSREEYKCPSCPYTCTIEKAFLRHLRHCDSRTEDGLRETRRSCPICGKDRDGEKMIVTHMLKHRDGKQFCCDLCAFRTLQLKKLIQHRRMHTGEKPHLCPFCVYRSARRDNLRSHVRRVHKKENLTCDTFTPRSMLLTPTIRNVTASTKSL